MQPTQGAPWGLPSHRPAQGGRGHQLALPWPRLSQVACVPSTVCTGQPRAPKPRHRRPGTLGRSGGPHAVGFKLAENMTHFLFTFSAEPASLAHPVPFPPLASDPRNQLCPHSRGNSVLVKLQFSLESTCAIPAFLQPTQLGNLYRFSKGQSSPAVSTP